MPLINGACIPAVCMKRAFPQNVKLWQTITVGGVVKQAAKDITNNPMYANLLADGRKMMVAQETLECDGCVCYQLVKFNPPLVVPFSIEVERSESTDAQDVVTEYLYELTGKWSVLTLGMCIPPGARVEVGGQMIPVEEAPQHPKEYAPK